MKRIITLLLLTLISQISLAQGNSTWTEIDTIKTFPNKTLVEYKSYSDSTLNEKAGAYLFPVVHHQPKYRLFGNLIQTEIELDSIVFHGVRVTYLDHREFKKEQYNNGQLISTGYFDSNGETISEQEFTNLNNVRGPCGLITGYYLIHGTKKKEQTKHKNGSHVK